MAVCAEVRNEQRPLKAGPSGRGSCYLGSTAREVRPGAVEEETNKSAFEAMDRAPPATPAAWPTPRTHSRKEIQKGLELLEETDALELVIRDHRNVRLGRVFASIQEIIPSRRDQGLHLQMANAMATEDHIEDWFEAGAAEFGRCTVHLCLCHSQDCGFRSHEERVIHISEWRPPFPEDFSEKDFFMWAMDKEELRKTIEGRRGPRVPLEPLPSVSKSRSAPREHQPTTSKRCKFTGSSSHRWQENESGAASSSSRNAMLREKRAASDEKAGGVISTGSVTLRPGHGSEDPAVSDEDAASPRYASAPADPEGAKLNAWFQRFQTRMAEEAEQAHWQNAMAYRNGSADIEPTPDMLEELEDEEIWYTLGNSLPLPEDLLLQMPKQRPSKLLAQCMYLVSRNAAAPPVGEAASSSIQPYRHSQLPPTFMEYLYRSLEILSNQDLGEHDLGHYEMLSALLGRLAEDRSGQSASDAGQSASSMEDCMQSLLGPEPPWPEGSPPRKKARNAIPKGPNPLSYSPVDPRDGSMEDWEDDGGEPNPQEETPSYIASYGRDIRPLRNDGARFEAQVRDSKLKPSCSPALRRPPAIQGTFRQRFSVSWTSKRARPSLPREQAPENSSRRGGRVQQGFRLNNQSHRKGLLPDDEGNKKSQARRGFDRRRRKRGSAKR